MESDELRTLLQLDRFADGGGDGSGGCDDDDDDDDDDDGGGGGDGNGCAWCWCCSNAKLHRFVIAGEQNNGLK